MDWKRANVAPIFKKGKKCDVGNYRPVSLTSIVCKVMESIIKDSVTEHLGINKVIRNTQHGFRKNRSCLTNLLEYLESLTKLVDEGHAVDMIYLDFAKAFDKVPAKRLLAKIRSCGIDEKVTRWIGEWLSGREQRVVLNGAFSLWTAVLSGVPQGSVLGPLSFIIFVNDIDLVIYTVKSILSKFADDTKSGRVIKNKTDRMELQEDLNNLALWAEKWQMQFNADKCKIIHFGRRNPEFEYSINGHTLETVEEEKDVGVMISCDLKPSKQCAKAAKKANSVLGQMSRAVTYRDKITWIGLYKQFVRPHLEYCVQCWSPWTQQDIILLENVQKRAVRMVSGLTGKSYEEKLREINLTSLIDRRARGDLIQTWKIIHGKDDIDKEMFFKLVPEPENRRINTRFSSGKLNIIKPRANTEIRKNFFSVRVIDEWNNLPEEIKSAKTLNQFKNLYDDFKNIVM